MTTPFFPTKKAITETTFAPAQMIEDERFENYLINLASGEGILFIKSVMSAYRAGRTSVTFICSSFSIANAIYDFLMTGPTPYGYNIIISENVTITNSDVLGGGLAGSAGKLKVNATTTGAGITLDWSK